MPTLKQMIDCGGNLGTKMNVNTVDSLTGQKKAASRSPNEGEECLGTDINRNFAIGWGGWGASFNPCTPSYHGDDVWSEVEARNVRDYVLSLANPVFFHDMHSYKQLGLLPNGYTGDLPPDYDDIFSVATKVISCTQL